jgi:hypothetical protein
MEVFGNTKPKPVQDVLLQRNLLATQNQNNPGVVFDPCASVHRKTFA